MMHHRKSLLAATVASCFTLLSGCAMTPFQIALFDPVQLFSRETDVNGLRLNLIYGDNRTVRGLDAGVANWVEGDQTGIQIGLHNNCKGQSTGLQSGLVNWGERGMAGMQIASLVNRVKGTMTGIQVSGANSAYGLRGCQVALFNGATDMRGFQLGVVNIAEGSGVQIGLVNLNRNGFLPFFPIINVGL